MKCTIVVLVLLRTKRASNLIRFLVLSVRSKDSTTVVHFIIFKSNRRRGKRSND